MGPFFTSKFFMTTKNLTFLNEASFVVYYAGIQELENQTLALNGSSFNVTKFPLLKFSLQQNFVPDLTGKSSICVSSNHSFGSFGGEGFNFHFN